MYIVKLNYNHIQAVSLINVVRLSLTSVCFYLFVCLFAALVLSQMLPHTAGQQGCSRLPHFFPHTRKTKYNTSVYNKSNLIERRKLVENLKVTLVQMLQRRVKSSWIMSHIFFCENAIRTPCLIDDKRRLLLFLLFELLIALHCHRRWKETDLNCSSLSVMIGLPAPVVVISLGLLRAPSPFVV